ncbi:MULTISPECIES: alpha/beta hydrolase [unclassified Ruegeria]|uniref:alpha/beta fold hydrolase n=1 Tax=unclassified Ruegeria TaxID=2625375 RepID=UPI001ADB55AB|nr:MULTISPECIES: alpha/beta hydrolase [unclassified Ruegeria]MBO9411944.1 alpha/beta fold hydrolase [Ruegeria sp. R8_1]MBO9417053.1 alpha/beta fold hydrolase [Ruegeria sp. R8_2]
MTPLILLPGMMCDARLFGPQIDALSGKVPMMTFPLCQHDSVQELAADILRNAPPVFALAGLSMGGIVAMEVLRQAPERIERLALLDTNPMAELPDVKARRAPQMDAVREGRLWHVMRDEMKPNYLADGPRQGAVLDLCMEMATDLGPQVFLRQSQALMDRPDQRATLAAYTGPALVLCGREDGLCPVERHQLMHDLLPNSVLHVIDGAGHLPTLEKPNETTAALARWLEDI